MYMAKGNMGILFGGGQIPSANYAMAEFALIFMRLCNVKVYGIYKSFMGLADSTQFELLTKAKVKEIKGEIGTYFETCRKFKPNSEEYFYKILANLKAKNIKILVVFGGDGSSRACAALAKKALENGYDLQIILIPCTIDGIENSDSIGKDAAIKESARQTALIAVNAFATYNPNCKGSRVAISEIMGRNRNDITIGVMREMVKSGHIGKYKLKDVNLILLPTAYEWSYISLLKGVNSSSRETLIITAEGAKPIEADWEEVPGGGTAQKLEKLINLSGVRAVNSNVVGYLSQSNYCFDMETEKINKWVEYAAKVVLKTYETVAVIKNGDKFDIMPLEEFAAATSSDIAMPLTEGEIREFAKYLP